ncbi:MAG: glycosyltransferase, partial [Rhodospirillales bacterium]|nr:glycosyltransferase [Rhodospirillales bacterium]
MSEIKLSALVVAHNEEDRIAACLDRLKFADEIVVVLDKCTDGTKTIVANYTDRVLEGSWDIEGDRRNEGLKFCQGEWILEIDSDEWVTEQLATNVRQAVNESTYGWHEISVDNYIGDRLVRYGWG